MKSALPLALILCLAVKLLAPSVAGAQGSYPARQASSARENSPFVTGGVYFYDTTGPAGVGRPSYPTYKSVRYIWGENGYFTHDPLEGWFSWAFAFVASPGGLQAGEAYYWEVETGVSEVRKVSGIWVADALYPFGYWPYLVYPMPGEWGGDDAQQRARG